jgi:hypothetical protein
MFNWALLSPRNLVVIAVFSLIALMAFNHFHKSDDQ